MPRSLSSALTVVIGCIASFVLFACTTSERTQQSVPYQTNGAAPKISVNGTDESAHNQLPRSYDGVALGMSLSQIKAIFPDLREDILYNENGPAFKQYNDKGDPAYKTCTADAGQSGFIFINNCLVSFFTTTSVDYEKLEREWEAKYGAPAKVETLPDGDSSHTWNDEVTENTIQSGAAAGFYLDAIDFQNLAAEFQEHGGKLVDSPSSPAHQWVIYDGVEYVPGYSDPTVMEPFLSAVNGQHPTAQKKFFMSAQVVKLVPGTKLKKLATDEGTSLVQAKILSGPYRGQTRWIEYSFIDRVLPDC